MRLDASRECLVCDFCESVHFPKTDADGVAALGEPSEKQCPVCSIPLVKAAVGGQELLYCKRCRGLLIEMGVFSALVDRLRGENDEPPETPHTPDSKDLERVLRCPKCGAKMDTHYYAGPGRVVIDSCSECLLVWLDHSELRHIVRGAEGPPPENWSPTTPLPVTSAHEGAPDLLSFLLNWF